MKSTARSPGRARRARRARRALLQPGLRLAYAGLAVPYLVAPVAPHIGYPHALLLTAAAAALTLTAVLLRGGARPLRRSRSTPNRSDDPAR